MPHLSSSIEQTRLTPPASTGALAAVAGVVILMALAVLVTREGSALFGVAASVLGIIQGPLVDGPLVDVGNLLSDNQLGQFQQ